MKKYRIYKYFDDCDETLVAIADTKEDAEKRVTEYRNNENSIYTTYSIKEVDVPEPESLKKGDIIWDSGKDYFRLFELIATADDNTLEARKKAGRENITMCESTMLNLEDNNIYAGSLKGFRNLKITHPNIYKIINGYVNQDNRPLTPEILANAGWQKGEDTPHHVYYSLDLDEDFGKETDFCAFMTVRFVKQRDIVGFDIERTFGDSIRSTFRRKITVEEFNTLLDIVKLEKFKIK